MKLCYILFFFFVTIIIGFFVNKFFLNKSKKYTLIKANISGVRWNTQAKPIFGGIAFYSVFLFTIIIYFFFFGYDLINNDKFIGLFLIITLSFFMGLADDLINTSHYFKFIVQILCGVILIYFGTYINLFSNNYLNYILTILWVVGIMNSINMLDNMDGISSLISISIIIGIILNIIISEYSNSSFYLFICIGTLASLLSFLFFNWHPSKMYMGDNGSQFLGSILAAFGIIFYWNFDSSQVDFSNSKAILTVALAFIIPISDTTTVTINRLLKKKSPFIGGKDHTTHHLSYFGLSDKKVGIILFVISLISISLSVILRNFITEMSFIKILFFGSFPVIILVSLYLITKISKPDK